MANPVRIKALIAGVTKHSECVYTVTFQPLGRVPRYKAGQFMHLALDHFDPTTGFWPESRVFSIASRFGNAELEIVYSVKGRFTRRMEAELRPGLEVWLKLPYGDFIIDEMANPGDDLVLIAGGTGITPFIPYLHSRLIAETSPSGRIQMHYGFRNSALHLYRELLSACCSKIKGFELYITVEQETSGMLQSGEQRISQGILSIGMILDLSGSLRDPLFLLSGPPTMVMTFKDFLRIHGVPEGRVKTDDWE